MTKIEIKPVSRQLTNLVIGNISVSLNSDAYVSGQIHNDKLFETFQLYMPSDVYNQWGTNDDFLIDWVLQELGLQRA